MYIENNKILYLDWIVEIMKLDPIHFKTEQIGAQKSKMLSLRSHR